MPLVARKLVLELFNLKAECLYLIRQKPVHSSEFNGVIRGDIKVFRECRIFCKTSA